MEVEKKRNVTKINQKHSCKYVDIFEELSIGIGNDTSILMSFNWEVNTLIKNKKQDNVIEKKQGASSSTKQNEQ